LTQPVQDIVNGCVLYLKAQPEVLAAVDTFDIQGVPTSGIFSYQLACEIQQTQKLAVVVQHEGGWATPNIHNTLRFPRLLVNIWIDPIRDAQGNKADPRIQARANACFEVIDKFLHMAAGGDLMFGPVRVVDCVRLTEPAIDNVRDGDGMVLLRAFYAVTQG
jgi:hypothetical protein